MSGAKHTPGPWQADECPDAKGLTTIRPHDGTENGDMDAPVIATVYAETDAALIVAAPELLAVARELAALWESRPVQPERIQETTGRLRAAIAKAEGRS
jgi:hypothetical protein